MKCYAGKVGATGKNRIPNAGNAAGYGYTGKAGTVLKSEISTNASDTVLYGYTGKVGAIGKSAFPNAGNAVGYGYTGKVGATVKSVLPNGGNAVSYGYAGKPEAI